MYVLVQNVYVCISAKRKRKEEKKEVVIRNNKLISKRVI